MLPLLRSTQNCGRKAKSVGGNGRAEVNRMRAYRHTVYIVYCVASRHARYLSEFYAFLVNFLFFLFLDFFYFHGVADNFYLSFRATSR